MLQRECVLVKFYRENYYQKFLRALHFFCFRWACFFVFCVNGKYLNPLLHRDEISTLFIMLMLYCAPLF